MSWVLLTNDDGIDSPALLPLAAAVEARLDLPVEVCVPDRERSWSGKAVTRTDTIDVASVARGGRPVTTVSGTPADAVQVGVHGPRGHGREEPPALVVSGINVGHNVGGALLASSGTVWAAAEATYAGLPAVAVSTGSSTDEFAAWRRRVTADDELAAAGWRRVAATATAVVARVLATGLHEHCDLVSINLPWEADDTSPWTLTALAELRYGALFEDAGRGRIRSRPVLDIDAGEPSVDGVPTDAATLRRGAVSITPVRLPRAAPVPDHVRAALTVGTDSEPTDAASHDGDGGRGGSETDGGGPGGGEADDGGGGSHDRARPSIGCPR